MREIKYIILHHSGTPATNWEKDPTGQQIYEAIKRNHHARAVAKKWGDNYVCDYHFLIGPTGKVFEGQPVEMVSYHCGYYRMNLKSIGICLLGDFEKVIPTKIQVDSLTILILELMKKYGILIESIQQHKQIVQTDCAGKYFPFNRIIKEVKDEMGLKEPTEADKAFDLMIRLGVYQPYGDLDIYKAKLIDYKTLAVLLARVIEHIQGGA